MHLRRRKRISSGIGCHPLISYVTFRKCVEYEFRITSPLHHPANVVTVSVCPCVCGYMARE